MNIDSGDYGYPPGIDSGAAGDVPHPVIMTGPEALRLELAEVRGMVQVLAVEVGHLREAVARLAVQRGAL